MGKNFWYAVGIRALRTFCQAALASIGTAAAMAEVNWGMALSTGCLAAIVSAMMSIITGLPEVDETPEVPKAESKGATIHTIDEAVEMGSKMDDWKEGE